MIVFRKKGKFIEIIWLDTMSAGFPCSLCKPQKEHEKLEANSLRTGETYISLELFPSGKKKILEIDTCRF